MSPSQHKQDTLSVSAVLSAVSAAGHEDVEVTSQKNGWESFKFYYVLDAYIKTDCPRAGQRRKPHWDPYSETHPNSLPVSLSVRPQRCCGTVAAARAITGYPALSLLPQGLKTQRKSRP